MQICVLNRSAPIASMPHICHPRRDAGPLAFRQVAAVQVVRYDKGKRIVTAELSARIFDAEVAGAHIAVAAVKNGTPEKHDWLAHAMLADILAQPV